jgi:3-deoxy-D-manno-octulosonic-acid transferase
LAKIFGLRIFDKFSEIISQTKKDVENFEKLSGKKVHFFGNLKSQAKVLEVDEQELQKLQNEIGNRKIFLAASTHEGEEKIILNIHQELKKKFSNLLTIIAIRHPNRSEEVANLINVKFVKRTDKKQIQNDDEIYLVDTLGELGVFYSLVDFTFIGGSISKNGGHNPYEAIKLNSAVISGKNIFNFKEIYNELEENNACEIVDNEDQMLEKIEEFLTKEEKSTKLQINAQQLISRKKDVISELILIINR